MLRLKLIRPFHIDWHSRDVALGEGGTDITECRCGRQRAERLTYLE